MKNSIDILNPDIIEFFFGPHFNINVAQTAISGYDNLPSLKNELTRSIEQGTIHTGIQLVGYENVDTGLSTAVLLHKPHSPSMVSFFVESHHRLFGGKTLVCVPLIYCSSFYHPVGDHLVYRHTYKRPNFESGEYEKVMRLGTPEEKIRTLTYTKSRDGYTTIPGMSYVGMTKRTWQERYIEHLDSALKKKSSTRFHDAIRKMEGQNGVHVHDISAFGLSGQDAKAYESKLIKKSTLWPLGLNMKM